MVSPPGQPGFANKVSLKSKSNNKETLYKSLGATNEII